MKGAARLMVVLAGLGSLGGDCEGATRPRCRDPDESPCCIRTEVFGDDCAMWSCETDRMCRDRQAVFEHEWRFLCEGGGGSGGAVAECTAEGGVLADAALQDALGFEVGDGGPAPVPERQPTGLRR